MQHLPNHIRRFYSSGCDSENRVRNGSVYNQKHDTIDGAKVRRHGLRYDQPSDPLTRLEQPCYSVIFELSCSGCQTIVRSMPQNSRCTQSTYRHEIGKTYSSTPPNLDYLRGKFLLSLDRVLVYQFGEGVEEHRQISRDDLTGTFEHSGMKCNAKELTRFSFHRRSQLGEGGRRDC